MPRAQPTGAMYDGFGHYFFSGRCFRNACFYNVFKGFSIISFLADRFCTPRNVRFPIGFLRVFGKPCSGIISFLARARGSLKTQRFPMVLHGFAVFLSCRIIFFLAGPIRNCWFYQGFLRFSGNHAAPGIGKCAET